MTDILDDLEAKAWAVQGGNVGTRFMVFSPEYIIALISRCRKAEAEVERLGNNIIGLDACEKIYQHDVEVHLLKPKDEEISRLKVEVGMLRGILAEAHEGLKPFAEKTAAFAEMAPETWVSVRLSAIRDARSISAKIEETMK